MKSPKEILVSAINDYLCDSMNDLGFKFYESRLKFKRKRGNFSQEIWFTGYRKNKADKCVQFSYSFVIYNAKYKNFLKDCGEKIVGASGLLQGDHSILKTWDRSKQSAFGYDFLKMDNREIMNDIFKSVETIGLEYFNKNDSAEKLAKWGQGIEKIDFQIMIGDFVEAKRIFKEFSLKYAKMNDKEQRKNEWLFERWRGKMAYIKRITDANST